MSTRPCKLFALAGHDQIASSPFPLPLPPPPRALIRFNWSELVSFGCTCPSLPPAGHHSSVIPSNGLITSISPSTMLTFAILEMEPVQMVDLNDLSDWCHIGRYIWKAMYRYI